jgi:hypothetical protein
MQTSVEKVLKKLKHLSPQRVSEVEDFIDFLKQKDNELSLREDFAHASETSFANVWDNDEDAAYDRL